MQRSEGGGLGVGGSSSGIMTARGAADFLTRSTSILGGMFIVLSIFMAAIAGATREPAKIDTSLANSAAPLQDDQAQPAPGPTGPASSAAGKSEGSGSAARAISEQPLKIFSRAAGCPTRRSAPKPQFPWRGSYFVTGGVVSSLGKGLALGVARGAAAGARLQGPHPQVRSLPQRRSGDDVARISMARSM